MNNDNNLKINNLKYLVIIKSLKLKLVTGSEHLVRKVTFDRIEESFTRVDDCFSDLSDVPENLPLPAPGSESPQALNYSQIASEAVAVSQGGQDPSVSSTETLLRNIQGLLKVAADNARQQERQINYEKGQWHGLS